MRAYIISLFLSLCLPCFAFAQVAPTASGNVLTYEVFTAKQGVFQTEITFELNKARRVLKLNIEENGDRKYVYKSNDKTFTVYDKFFTVLSFLGKPATPGDSFVLLPKNQKVEVGTQWEFSRSGQDDVCVSYNGKYLSGIKEGPDTLINIDGKDVQLKTLLIEIGADILQGNPACTTRTSKRIIHYSSELNEILMDQFVDTERKSLVGGYKWVLKSITTAGQAAK